MLTEKAAKKIGAGRGIKLPKFELYEIEDYYTFYVIIMEIPENTFWENDLRFLDAVLRNKAAYDRWLRYAIEKEGERRGR